MNKGPQEDGSRAYTVIWARPERAAKGPAPSRSRAQIAAAAVQLADDEGLEAVSMRKVAAALGIGAASLYRYIESKDELYELMVDLVEGEDGPPPPLSGDWRADLTAFAHKTRASIHRHPWMASLAAGRPTFGPNSLAWAEYGLAAIDGLGLSIDEMLMAGEILRAFVRGYTIGELAEQQALQRAGLTHGPVDARRRPVHDVGSRSKRTPSPEPGHRGRRHPARPRPRRSGLHRRTRTHPRRHRPPTRSSVTISRRVKPPPRPRARGRWPTSAAVAWPAGSRAGCRSRA